MKYIKLFEQFLGKPAVESPEGKMSTLSDIELPINTESSPDKPKILINIFKIVNSTDKSLLDQCQYLVSNSSIEIVMPQNENIISKIEYFLNNEKDDQGQKYTFIRKYTTDRNNNVWFQLKIIR